jgi:hypothetical protein
MNWKEYSKNLLQNLEFRGEYEALEPEYRMVSTMIRLRLEKGSP